MGEPRVVLLTGEPGSGKTTLGLALSGRLHLPFVARDHVRSALSLSSGSIPSREVATEAFLSTIEAMATLGVSCVAEYVVRAHQPEHLDRITAVADCVVVRVTCDDPVRRRTARGADDEQEAHMRAVTAVMRTDFDGLPVLVVDATEGYDPPLEAIVEFARSRSDR